MTDTTSAAPSDAEIDAQWRESVACCRMRSGIAGCAAGKAKSTSRLHCAT